MIHVQCNCTTYYTFYCHVLFRNKIMLTQKILTLQINVLQQLLVYKFNVVTT